MKITKRQLRRIIKEENVKLMAEQRGLNLPTDGYTVAELISALSQFPPDAPVAVATKHGGSYQTIAAYGTPPSMHAMKGSGQRMEVLSPDDREAKPEWIRDVVILYGAPKK
jgi:hypothetical protein